MQSSALKTFGKSVTLWAALGALTASAGTTLEGEEIDHLERIDGGGTRISKIEIPENYPWTFSRPVHVSVDARDIRRRNPDFGNAVLTVAKPDGAAVFRGPVEHLEQGLDVSLPNHVQSLTITLLGVDNPISKEVEIGDDNKVHLKL